MLFCEISVAMKPENGQKWPENDRLRTMKTQPYPEDIETPEAFDDLEDNSGDDSTLELVAAQGGRLDQVLAEMIPEHSRNRLQQWIKAGRVLVDGELALEPKQKIYGGEDITVRVDHVLTEAQAGTFLPEPMDLQVVYED